MERKNNRSRKPRTPNPVDVHVGSKVKLRRILLGMSQENLGDRIGLTFQQVQKYEKGINRIGASRLFELAIALNVNVQFFYDGAPVAGTHSSIPGFSEDAGLDQNPPLDDVEQFMTNRESIELNRAFAKISDPQIRRSVVDLVRVIADHGAADSKSS